jgi:outer membrane immunogenic protein
MHTIKAGLNYRFDWEGARSVAAANPMFYKAPPAQVSWTGFYAGGHVGAGWGDKWWDSTGHDPFGTPLFVQDIGQNLGTTSVDGFLGGGQIGFNYQTGRLVLGVEADASATGLKGKLPCAVISAEFDLANLFTTCSSKIDWIGTVVGRVGVTVDRALVYAGGGGAWAHEKDHLECTDGDCGSPFTQLFTWDGANTKWGWTFLAGTEYAIDNHWSAKLQYNFYDFEDSTVTLVPNQQTLGCAGSGCTDFDVTTRLRIHTIKAGLNYKFDWAGPVVAKY